MVERTLRYDSFQEGKIEGKAEGIAEGIEMGIERGVARGQNKEKLAIAKKMLLAGVSDSQILEFTGLTQEQIDRECK